MTRQPAKAANWRVDWASHREAQLISVAAATPAQRLAWLEEAIRLAYRTGALPRRDDRSEETEFGEPSSPNRAEEG